MKSETLRTDEAARQGCYFTTGDYASTCGKQIVHIDFARQLETELNEAKSQVNELNNLLRHAGWGQGEIDSASSLVMELEELQKNTKSLVGAILNFTTNCPADPDTTSNFWEAGLRLENALGKFTTFKHD